MSGYGFGSFLEGMADGLQTSQALAARQTARELEERRLQLLEEEAKRKVENDAYERDYKNKQMRLLEDQNSRAAAADKRLSDKYNLELKEYEANAPLRDSTRKAGMLTQEGLIHDQTLNKEISDIRESALRQHETAREKAIIQGKDEGGNPIFSVEGQKYGSREEAQSAFEKNHPFWKEFNSNPNGLNKLVNTLEAAGKYVDAEAARKFYSDKNAANGVEQQGRLVMAFDNQDIEGAKKHLTELMKDPNYLIQDGYDIKVDFAKDDKGNTIKGENGKPLGLQYSMTNKRTGEVFADKAIGHDEIITKLGWAAHPESIIQWNMTQRERILKEKAEERKKELEIGGKIIENNAKLEIEEKMKFRKSLDESQDANIRAMAPEQKDALTNQTFSRLKQKSVFAPKPGQSQPYVPLTPQNVR